MTACGEPVEELMERDRVRGGQRSVDGQRARDDAERPDRSGFMRKRLPDLAHEGDDRGFSAGAGDRDDGLGLARIKARGGVSFAQFYLRGCAIRGARAANQNARRRAFPAVLCLESALRQGKAGFTKSPPRQAFALANGCHFYTLRLISSPRAPAPPRMVWILEEAR